MNIMRKLLVGPPRAAPVEDPQQHAQHTALGLMHLKKLFAEYTHPQIPLSQKEQEDRLYNMLPLFCKVFGNSPAKDMTDKFGDILAFCQQVSKLMVSEIRRRASNQSTEAASWAIVKFLEIESTEESSNGWMLLSTINLLASGDPSLIEGYQDNPKINAIYVMKGTLEDVPKLPPLSTEAEEEFFKEETIDDKKPTKNRRPSGPRTPDPYSMDDSSIMLPVFVAIGAFIPLLFCLCKL